MSYKIIEINCPGCGARVSIEQNECIYCSGPIVIATYSSFRSMPVKEIGKLINEYEKVNKDNNEADKIDTSIAFCNLKLKLYDKAIVSFEKLIDNNQENPELYFYASISLLSGNKAFLANRSVIDKIEKYINASISIEPKGIYYYFWAYIKYDYFHRKYLNTKPNYKELLFQALDFGVSEYDKNELFMILNVPKPEVL